MAQAMLLRCLVVVHAFPHAAHQLLSELQQFVSTIRLRAGAIMYIQSGMDIEFGLAKDASNTAKHGVSLAFGEHAFKDGAHIILPSIRPIDGEGRFKVIGEVDGKLWTAIYVLRGVAVRFISVRRSNDGEERIYGRP